MNRGILPFYRCERFFASFLFVYSNTNCSNPSRSERINRECTASRGRSGVAGRGGILQPGPEVCLLAHASQFRRSCPTSWPVPLQSVNLFLHACHVLPNKSIISISMPTVCSTVTAPQLSCCDAGRDPSKNNVVIRPNAQIWGNTIMRHRPLGTQQHGAALPALLNAASYAPTRCHQQCS